MRMRPISAANANYGHSIAKELSPQFVDSLRVLFDILDTSRSGVISFDHMANKWRQLPTRGLPNNFLDCLRRVTPPNRMLDFGRFIAGVRLSLSEKNFSSISQKNPANLHRVRSEGKLHDIANHATNWREFANRSMTNIKYGPTMGVNALHPNAKCYNSLQMQKRQEYRSQPDISTRDFDFMDKHPNSIKENYASVSKYSQQEQQQKKTDYDIVMRNKTMKNIRAPLPPQGVKGGSSYEECFSSPSSATSALVNRENGAKSSRNRPNSINSAMSGSSGFSELHSNNSSTTLKSGYADELRPQVAKHEFLLAEEYTIVRKAADTTRRLQQWLHERVDSLEKRKRMLERGMVALDSAVHEQKLNFYRAQIMDLTRRMNALMGTSEHGFPNHRNMNAQDLGELEGPVTRGINNDISGRISRPFDGSSAISTKVTGSLGSAGSSTRTSTSMASSSRDSSSANSSPEPKVSVQAHDNINALVKQQEKLFQELDAKSRLIEKLQREKRVHEMREATTGFRHEKAAETIRKPMAIIGERCLYQNENRKIVRDTFL